jgi:hypothetical protein
MAKDKFDVLHDDFKDKVNAADDVDVKKIIADTALAHASLMASQADDEDWNKKREDYSDANQIYAESTKFSKLKIAYCREMLKNRGAKV